MKFTAHVSTSTSLTSKASVDFEIDDEDLEGLDTEARDKMIDETATEVLSDGGYFTIEVSGRD